MLKVNIFLFLLWFFNHCHLYFLQQVVLLPVLGGALLNQYFQPLVKFVNPLMPPMAVITVAILCGHAISQSSSTILTSGGQVILACCLLHAFGFFFGYVLARMLGIDVSSSRTISIEVGMQVNLVFYYCIVKRDSFKTLVSIDIEPNMVILIEITVNTLHIN